MAKIEELTTVRYALILADTEVGSLIDALWSRIKRSDDYSKEDRLLYGALCTLKHEIEKNKKKK